MEKRRREEMAAIYAGTVLDLRDERALLGRRMRVVSQIELDLRVQIANEYVYSDNISTTSALVTQYFFEDNVEAFVSLVDAENEDAVIAAFIATVTYDWVPKNWFMTSVAIYRAEETWSTYQLDQSMIRYLKHCIMKAIDFQQLSGGRVGPWQDDTATLDILLPEVLETIRAKASDIVYTAELRRWSLLSELFKRQLKS